MGRPWRMLDTFSGIGGFSLAAEWTGRISPVAFIELDPFCRSVLRKWWPSAPIFRDIRDTILFGDIDLITGGFPCQPFSAAGQQRGALDDRYLWPELARFVAVLRPRWCLFENVPGIINMAGGLERVFADLEAEGYQVEAMCLPACAVGAPHKRDRVWVVAHAAGAGSPRGERAGSHQSGRRVGHEPTECGSHVDDPEGAGCGLPHALHERPATGDEHAFGDAGDALAVANPTTSVGIRSQGQQSGGAEARAIERGGCGHETQPRLGAPHDGISRWMDGRLAAGPLSAFGENWEEGVPRVTQECEDRVNRLKALGNSIVPQVAYVIMQAMLEADDAK